MSGALSLVALTAFGQFLGTINLDINGQTAVSVNTESCGKSLTANWTTALSGGVCSDLQFWVTAGDCGDAPVTGDLKLTGVTQTSLAVQRNQTGTVSIAVNKLPSLTADGGTICGTEGAAFTDQLCSSVTLSSDGTCAFKTVQRQVSPVTITYDTAGPAAPTISQVDPLDQAVSLTFTVSDDTDSVQVQQKSAADAEFHDVSKVSGTALKAVVSGLANGTEYQFVAIAFDAAGNPSVASEAVSATPRTSKGFWGACRDAGCSTAQGCTAAGGSLSLAALGALLLLRLKRRTR